MEVVVSESGLECTFPHPVAPLWVIFEEGILVPCHLHCIVGAHPLGNGFGRGAANGLSA